MKKANHAYVLKEAESPSEEAEPPSSALLEDSNNSALSLLFPELIQFPLPKPDKTFHKISIRSLQFLRKYFPLATKADWNNWEWQLRNSITSWQALQQVLQLSDEEVSAMTVQSGNLPLRVTPYYASLLDPVEPHAAAAPQRGAGHRRTPDLRRAKPPIRWAKTPTAACPGWCTAIPTGSFSWSPVSARATAATARVRAWWATRTSATSTASSGTGP